MSTRAAANPPQPAAGPSWGGRLVVIVAVLLLGVVLYPNVPIVREEEGWKRVAGSLRQVGEALRHYHDSFGSLPPAVVRGKDGKPLYSWRVALLPFMEQDHLYRQLKLDEPWDSPHNRPFLEKMPRCYDVSMVGYDPPGLTRLKLVVGPGTAFERDGLTWADFAEGGAKTLLVVESAEPVPWTRPGDLKYDPDGPLPPLVGVFDKPVRVLGYTLHRQRGFVGCFGDGKPRFFDDTTDEATLRGYLERDGPKR